MDLPARVEEAIGEEAVAASVDLAGEDRLYVTPTRTLIYQGQGLISDDSVNDYPHDAARVEVDAGRRKATVRLDYGIDGTREFEVPANRLDEALHPVLAGVLNASGVTTDGETVLHTHRFSELTLVVTSHRAAKHVGEAVWDQEFEDVAYADVTAVSLEEGSVASQLVMETSTRTQRIKIPQAEAPRVHRRVVDALCEFHGVSDYDAFERMIADRDDDTPPDEESAAGAGFVDDGLDPIKTRGSDAADAAPASTQTAGSPDPDEPTGAEEPPQDEFADSRFERATEADVDTAIEERFLELEDVIDEQARLLEEQRALLRDLVEELNRDR